MRAHISNLSSAAIRITCFGAIFRYFRPAAPIVIIRDPKGHSGCLRDILQEPPQFDWKNPTKTKKTNGFQVKLFPFLQFTFQKPTTHDTFLAWHRWWVHLPSPANWAVFRPQWASHPSQRSGRRLAASWCSASSSLDLASGSWAGRIKPHSLMICQWTNLYHLTIILPYLTTTSKNWGWFWDVLKYFGIYLLNFSGAYAYCGFSSQLYTDKLQGSSQSL